MLRILFFLLLVFAAAIGFGWLANHPGDLVLTFGGYRYQVTVMVAAVIIAAIVVGVMASWWLLRSIWTSPYAISRYFRVRRRDRGYQALSTGMIAAGAGDATLARRKKKEALKLLSADQEPLLHLLDAQASLLEGDHAAARAKFESMVDDPETRLLGLRGLYLEAHRLGDRAAARHYAARAAEAAPQLGWASDATLEARTQAGEWDDALRLVDTQKSTHQIAKDVANRRKAVLLTAKALEMLDADPSAARTAALEANKLVPDLVPAATTAAKAAFRLDDTRKGAKVLEAVWKLQPHPEVADAYVHARAGDSTHDRLTRARKLQGLKPNNAESALAVARAALDAGEYDVARREVETAIRLDPREGAYLVLADIEEAQTGDQGLIRQWLGMALRAPRDPAWVADGYVSERWAPVSPVSGKLDAFEWKAPSERLGQIVETLPDAPPAPATPLPPVAKPAPRAPEPSPTVIDVIEPEAPAPKPAAPAAPPAPAPAVPPAAPATAAMAAAPLADFSASDPEDEPAPVPTRLPDDPGVEEAEPDEAAPSRFRLF